MNIGSGQPDQIPTSGTILVWGSGDNEAGQHQTPLDPLTGTGTSYAMMQIWTIQRKSASLCLMIVMPSASLPDDAAPSTLQTVNLDAEGLRFWLCCGAGRSGKRLGPPRGTPCRTSPPQEHFPTLHPPLYQLSTASTGL
jgi:hypothetical protein